MAFPTVESRQLDQSSGSQTTYDITLPAGITSGEKVLVVATFDGVPTITWPNDWTLVLENKNALGTPTISIIVAEADDLIASGETTKVTVNLNVVEQFASGAWRLSGAGAIEADVAEGNAKNADPPNLVPSGGSDDYLWIAAVGFDAARGIESYPADYTNTQTTVSSGGGDAEFGSAERLLTAASENPGPFASVHTAEEFNAATIAVAPSAAVSPHVFFDLTDLPADFGNAETATITVRTRGVDIGATPLKLFAQIFQSDETTVLSDEVEVAEEATDSSFTNSAPITFTGLNTTADKTVWDAARIRFRWGV